MSSDGHERPPNTPPGVWIPELQAQGDDRGENEPMPAGMSSGTATGEWMMGQRPPTPPMAEIENQSTFSAHAGTFGDVYADATEDLLSQSSDLLQIDGLQEESDVRGRRKGDGQEKDYILERKGAGEGHTGQSGGLNRKYERHPQVANHYALICFILSNVLGSSLTAIALFSLCNIFIMIFESF